MTDFETLKAMLIKAGIEPHAENGGDYSRDVITIVTGLWGCKWDQTSPLPDHSQDIHSMFVFDRDDGHLIEVVAYDGDKY